MDYPDDPLLNELNTSTTFDNEFFIYLFIVLMIFGLGFLAGNIAHDMCCHVIEQLQK